MKIINRRCVKISLCLGTALAIVSLVLGAWGAARPTPTAAGPAGQAAQRAPTAKHFTGTVHFDILAKLLADDRRGAGPDEWLRELAGPKATFHVKTQKHSLLERAAPAFILDNHHQQPWSLREHVSRRPVVLVFYLGYVCNACVHDLFELNADLERFRSLGAEVVAVSGDAPAFTLQRFEKYGAFGFTVLSDPGHVVAQSYGTFRPVTQARAAELLHATFLIGRDGRVHWTSYGDTPFRNNKALLYELARLEKKLPTIEPTCQHTGPGASGP